MNPFLRTSDRKSPWQLHCVLDIASDPDPVQVAGDGEKRGLPGNLVKEDLFQYGNMSCQLKLHAGFAPPVTPDVGLREVLRAAERKYCKVALWFRPLIP
jgi:hypothetical protein